ncbi:Helicase C-terminal domain-containing protein [Mycena venus]|uniref:Helicase C-terminal domain-containing protein n=1 Tax=Mycena venus TaxID=2733690 RepID=A0A8H6XC46_9AGAR|nr:Helicase C-terminal domain-containing protein [Mycena venus]
MANPWAIENFLSYGVLSIYVPDAVELQQELTASQQTLADDGWNLFAAPLILAYLNNPEDHALLRELDFLVAENFIFASFLVVESDVLFIRIYLIPYDLPGVQGRLRVRRDEIVGPARRCLSGILSKISRSPESWEGRSVPDSALVIPGTTLSGLYETLPSPLGFVTASSTPVAQRLLDFSDELGNLGFRSTLHRYQRRSVAAMVQKEMDLTDDPDPLFLPSVHLSPPCRGGILCEELGTGKTVMILGLVLSTIRQISEPEPSILDPRPILTPIAFRHFPSEEFATARTRFFRNKTKSNGCTPPRVPTLVELLLHKMVTCPVTFVPESQTHRYARVEEHVEDLEHLTALKKDNIPFYLDYQGEPIDNERTNKRRAPARGGPRLLYLTSATLIVVPQNLLLQWTQECSLHCEDSLRVCVLRGRDPIPPARVLATEYDIVLMSYSRFTAEDRTNNKGQTDSMWRGCTCAEYSAARVPKCVCKPPPCSPLLQIRWKRLVIDEGHVSASLSTVLTPFTKILSVERRWIVTGTPTTNLLGLNLGKKINEEADAIPSETSEIVSSRAPSEGPEPVEVDESPSSAPRVWTRDDGEDLTKLGNMIAHFVGVPQLLAKPATLRDAHQGRAPRSAWAPDWCGGGADAVDVLGYVSASVIADVEEEVKLPPVSQELVFLDLDPLAIKSYNAFQASIAINAVTSERKDQDYMFHPRNVAFLQEAVQNMSQIMFWSVDENFYNADEQLRTREEKMKKLDPMTTSPEDFELMNNAFSALEAASKDLLWRALQSHEDVPYRIYDLNPPIFEAWTRTTHFLNPDSAYCGFIHPDRVRELRNRVLRHPLISQDALIEGGVKYAKQDAERRIQIQESLKRKKNSKSSHGHDDGTSRLKAKQAAKNAADPKTVKEVQKELAVQSRSSPLCSCLEIAYCTHSPRLLGILQIKFYHRRGRVQPVLKRLLLLYSPLSLAHISEALELVGVDYLRFTTQITARVREQFVLTFETSEKYRVFLMELKHGARGLNLISASRVIFCEPVWRADVESQAIKRCHRIGQTRPITVKTLAIRGTAEENMAARRMALKDSTEKIPKLINESGMRAFIANPKFLAQSPTSLPIVEFPLVKLLPLDDEDVSMGEVADRPIFPAFEGRVSFAVDDIQRPPVKRHLDTPADDSPPRKRQVRLLLPNDSPPETKIEPKPRPRVRFA